MQYWRSLREKAVTNWEGERRTPAEESSMLKDGTGLFAWNVGKQLCTSSRAGRALSEIAAWYELLDTIVRTGGDIIALS